MKTQLTTSSTFSGNSFYFKENTGMIEIHNRDPVNGLHKDFGV
jgi:hypothetical protein